MERTFDTAEECINVTVLEDAQGSPGSFHEALASNAESLEGAEKAKVQHYITVTRESLYGMTIQSLDAGVGGLYDGNNIVMAQSTLMVAENVGSSLDQINETALHENYHKMNDHLAPMTMGSSVTGPYAVTIGEEAFTDTQVVEGLTVHETGNRFVSAEYVSHDQRLFAALIRAALTVDDLREAVNVRKDYRLIDDADRARAEEPDFSVAP